MSTVTCEKCGTQNDPAATNWWYCEKCTERLPRPGGFPGIAGSSAVALSAPVRSLDYASTAAAPKRKFRGEDVAGVALGTLLAFTMPSALGYRLGLIPEFAVLFISNSAMVLLCRGLRRLFGGK